MATKSDSERLEQYIGELNNLYTEWSNYKKSKKEQGDNGGNTVTQIVEMTDSIQKMQDAFTLLISNTLSYMKQRKDSIETKDKNAVSNIQK